MSSAKVAWIKKEMFAVVYPWSLWGPGRFGLGHVPAGEAAAGEAMAPCEPVKALIVAHNLESDLAKLRTAVSADYSRGQSDVSMV
jgi:hypothetical protein